MEMRRVNKSHLCNGSENEVERWRLHGTKIWPRRAPTPICAEMCISNNAEVVSMVIPVRSRPAASSGEERLSGGATCRMNHGYFHGNSGPRRRARMYEIVSNSTTNINSHRSSIFSNLITIVQEERALTERYNLGWYIQLEFWDFGRNPDIEFSEALNPKEIRHQTGSKPSDAGAIIQFPFLKK